MSDIPFEAWGATAERLVVLRPPRRGDDAETTEPVDPEAHRRSSIDAYLRAVFAARCALEAGERIEAADLSRAMRAVQRMVDLCERDETTLLAMEQVKNVGGFPACHGAGTAVLALSLGRSFGLPRAVLGDLGVAALLHEAGEAAVAAVLAASGPAFGPLRAALALHRFREPAVAADGKSEPLSHRILAAACFFDAATTPGPENRPTIAVPRVLRAMACGAGTRFDPRVVRALAGLVGRYPLGTVVRLDTGERAIVYGRNPHFDNPARPIVKIVADADGSVREDVLTVDLSLWDRERKCFAHSITEAHHPADGCADPAEYISYL